MNIFKVILKSAAIFIIFLTCLSPSTMALAQSSNVATLVRVSGTSHIKTIDEETYQAKVRSKILVGDEITTGADGWLTVNFFDLTRVLLRPNSHFKVTQFPATMDGGRIELELLSGAARVATGTIATRGREFFKVITPSGTVFSSRSEWVVQICTNGDCIKRQSKMPQCESVINPEEIDNPQPFQILSVYKGVALPEYCPIKYGLESGESLIYDVTSDSCLVIEQIPCLTLFDGKLGRDQIRKYRSKLKEIDAEEADRQRPERPASRPPRPRPRVDRPRRRR